MNAVLGLIRLGDWELGAVEPVAITSGSFACTAFPSVKLTASGGIPNGFTSVLGTVRLGLLELGAVPAGSVTAKQTTGKGSFQGKAFPDVAIKRLNLSGAFDCKAFPDVHAGGNRGPLLAVFSAFPDVVTSGIFYYPDGAFECQALPDVSVTGIKPGAAVCTAFPDVRLAPLNGQQVDCLTGANPPAAEVSNYAY